jgi:hypothetical protein
MNGRALTIASKRFTVVADKNVRVRRSKRVLRVATPELGTRGHLLNAIGEGCALPRQVEKGVSARGN